MQADQGTQSERERVTHTQACIHTEAQSSSADGDVSKPTPADGLERLIPSDASRPRHREREREIHTSIHTHRGTEQQCRWRCEQANTCR